MSPSDGPPPDHLRTADVLGALSLAADLALGLPAEHVLRACYIGMRLAEQLAIPPAEQVDLYYAELLMDAGCTAWTSQFAAFLISDEIVSGGRSALAAVALQRLGYGNVAHLDGGFKGWTASGRDTANA